MQIWFCCSGSFFFNVYFLRRRLFFAIRFLFHPRCVVGWGWGGSSMWWSLVNDLELISFRRCQSNVTMMMQLIPVRMMRLPKSVCDETEEYEIRWISSDSLEQRKGVRLFSSQDCLLHCQATEWNASLGRLPLTLATRIEPKTVDDLKTLSGLLGNAFRNNLNVLWFQFRSLHSRMDSISVELLFSLRSEMFRSVEWLIRGRGSSLRLMWWRPQRPPLKPPGSPRNSIAIHRKKVEKTESK